MTNRAHRATEYFFPSAIGRTAWSDIEHYAGPYVTCFSASDRSGAIVRLPAATGPVRNIDKTASQQAA